MKSRDLSRLPVAPALRLIPRRSKDNLINSTEAAAKPASTGNSLTLGLGMATAPCFCQQPAAIATCTFEN